MGRSRDRSWRQPWGKPWGDHGTGHKAGSLLVITLIKCLEGLKIRSLSVVVELPGHLKTQTQRQGQRQ